jgi:hypothetical protein
MLTYAGISFGGPGASRLGIAVGLTVAIILALISLMIAVEVTVNYIRLSSYGLAHHNPRAFASARDPRPLMWEAAALVGIVAMCVFVDASIVSFTATTGTADFDKLDLQGWGGLFNSFYSAFMTLIFSTPLDPNAIAAKVTIIFISLQGLAILVLAFTAFGAAKADE